jgi:hypothetical protein
MCLNCEIYGIRSRKVAARHITSTTRPLRTSRSLQGAGEQAAHSTRESKLCQLLKKQGSSRRSASATGSDLVTCRQLPAWAQG